MIDLLVLACLLGGPKHGYQIKKEAGLILGGGEVHNNRVYPLLHRFLRRKWVTRRKLPGHRGQTRFEYRLTPLGRMEMLRRLERYPESGSTDEAFYLRAGFFEVLSPEARARILQTREQQLRRQGEHYGRLAEEFSPPGYGGEVLSFLRRRTRLELDLVRRLDRVKTKSIVKTAQIRTSGEEKREKLGRKR
jgi:DNA-binding PadR family transcriptional regulator